MAMTWKQEWRLKDIIEDTLKLEASSTLTPEQEEVVVELKPHFPAMRSVINRILKEQDGFLAYKVIDAYFKGLQPLYAALHEIGVQHEIWEIKEDDNKEPEVGEIDFDTA